MRTHFITRLALLIGAAFLVVASQVWTNDTTLQWIFVGGGVVMILIAAADAVRDNVTQRSLDFLVALLGAWTIVQAFLFDGSDLKWWSFASGVALAALSVVGLIAHESKTERVVHELTVTSGRTHSPAAV